MPEANDLLERLRQQRPVDWEHLPDFALYMDQVLSYMERQVIRFDEDGGLTASMVNNYTKNGLVPRADGKKYNREHLAYLTVICVLKQVMAAKDIDLLIRESAANNDSVEESYLHFCTALDKALNMVADQIEDRDEAALAYEAIHFALLSYAAGVASNRYVSLLRQKKESDQGNAPKKSKKEHD